MSILVSAVNFIQIWLFEMFRMIAFFAIAFFVFHDLYQKYKTKKDSTTQNYIGIIILILFIIWPSIKEANIGNFGIKKLETKIGNIETKLQDLFNRKTRQYIFYDEFSKLKYSKTDDGKYFQYEIPLKYTPINNSVDLWLSKDLQNPSYYTVKAEEKKVIYRNAGDMETIKGHIDAYGEPTITLQYFVEL